MQNIAHNVLMKGVCEFDRDRGKESEMANSLSKPRKHFDVYGDNGQEH